MRLLCSFLSISLPLSPPEDVTPYHAYIKQELLHAHKKKFSGPHAQSKEKRSRIPSALPSLSHRCACHTVVQECVKLA